MRLKEATRKNVHQTHLEDLVLLGVEGFNELNDKIGKFLKRFSSEEKELNLTQKIDGAPALFCWSKYPGYPDNSIALKGFATGPQNAMSSVEQIDAKYGDRPDMAAKLKLGLQLARYIPAGECWQGDCLFSRGDLKEEEINGVSYLTFMPNKIVYAFSEENADYNKVRNADFGIAFHTIYKDRDGEMTQGFDVDPTRLDNVPSNFYIMSPAISASRDVHDYNVDALNREFNTLKRFESKLASNKAYNELINNATFMNYWNTFENATLADKKQVNINVSTFVQELKDYIKDKQTKEYNKKLNTLKTDQGRDKATAKFNSDVEKLDNIVETNKAVLSDLVNALNAAANVKMLMWEGLKKSKNDYSTYYKSRTKGYIPAEGEGIAMSDMDGNIVKIVDRSTFSSYNRDPDIMSGFEHESLEMHEDYNLNPALKKLLGDKEQEFKKLLRDLNLSHKAYDREIYPLGMYREERDKGSSQEVVRKFWLDKFGLDTAQRGVAGAIGSAIVSSNHDLEDDDEYKDTLEWDDRHRLPADEKYKIDLFYEWDAAQKNFFGDYADDDPIRKMSFREFLQDKLDAGDYEDEHEKQLLIDAISEVEGGSGYFKEMLATQRADMGEFNKKLILDEDGANHPVVLAFGRMNPPTIGHFKLIDKMASLAHGEKAKLYLSHKVNDKKDPLSYDSKVRWCKKAFGDKVDVIESPARNVFEVLADLYEDGYTDVIYVGGGDRIGGAEDISGSIMKYNGQKTGQGNILYDFDSIRFENAGERNPDSEDPSEQASASLVRKLVIEDNFDEFKRYVPFNDNDAKTLFKELKYAMLGKEESFLEECLFRENMLREATRLTKSKYTPEVQNALDKELNKIDTRLDAPDRNKGAEEYKQNQDNYTGLFVKQSSDSGVVYSEKDINKLFPNGDQINKELADLEISVNGADYKISSTGSSVLGEDSFSSEETTIYQEAISGLILAGRIDAQDVKSYLKESDDIFKYINVVGKDSPSFKSKWSNFVNK